LASALDLQTAASQSLPFILFHLSLAPVSAILRMGLGINKYLVICIITGALSNPITRGDACATMTA
jgi:hypothetical protein